MAYYPKNKIQSNLYTSGDEYVLASTKESYSGYYYKLSTGKFFTGRTPNDSNSKELIKIESKSINTLLTQAATYTYGLLSKNKLNTFKPKIIQQDRFKSSIIIIRTDKS
jgi:hypothetical protein